MFGQQCTRQLSTSPPPAFVFSTYPAADNPMVYPAFSPQSTYPPTASTAAPFFGGPYHHPSAAFYPDPLQYTSPATSTQLGTAVAAKRRTAVYAEEDILSPFNMTYASIAGIDTSPGQAYSDFGAAVNTPAFFSSHQFA